MGRAKKRVTDGTEKKLRNLVPFKPGQSGNPKGRPKGARNRLGLSSLRLWRPTSIKFGPQAIALVREKKPEVYMRVVADLLPKEANINVEAGEAFVSCGGGSAMVSEMSWRTAWMRSKRAGPAPLRH